MVPTGTRKEDFMGDDLGERYMTDIGGYDAKHFVTE
jgi:hypothetical protein